jgi:protein phosphatase
MGGAKAGNVASTAAVKSISEYIANSYRKNMSLDDITKMLRNAIISANIEVYDMATQNEQLQGMGTTVVAAIVSENFVYIAHAGDSRAYMISGGKPTQLTKDHSVVQRMIENGEITPEESESHPSKHIITRAMGVDSDIKVDFCQEPFDEDDILLLCSDGLTNYVDNSAVTELTEDGCYYDFADRLVNLANQNGGGDNITVVTVSQ